MKKIMLVFCLALCLTGLWAGGAKEAKDSGAKTTLKITLWDYTTTPHLKPLMAAFEAKFPQYKVEVIDIFAADYRDKLAIMLAGGEDADVIFVKELSDYAAMIQKNQIVDLNSYITRDKVDLSLYNGLTDAIKTADGKLYGLPSRSDYYVLYYNKDVFDKAGVPYPTPAMTWPEYRETAKKLTSGSGPNRIYGAHHHVWQALVMNWAVQGTKRTIMDGSYEFFQPAYDIFYNMQSVDKSVQDYAALKAANIGYQGAFASGNVGMLPMGTWFIGTVMSKVQSGEITFNWGVTMIPHWPGQKAGETVGAITPVVMNAKSKNMEGAWELVKFLSSEEGALVQAKVGTLPAIQTQAVMDAYTSTEGFPKGAAKDLRPTNIVLDRPFGDKVASVDKILGEEHSLIMIGQNSINKGIAEMNKRVQEILNAK